MRVTYGFVSPANFERTDIFRGYKLLMEWRFHCKYALKYASIAQRWGKKTLSSRQYEEGSTRCKYFSAGNFDIQHILRNSQK